MSKTEQLSTYVQRQQQINWHIKPPQLSIFDIELTERCNNNCIHCCINQPVNHQPSIHRELSASEWKELLSQASALGAASVRFTGGEPLLRSDFVELYLFARRLGLSVMLFTNGRLITPELADLFVRIPPRETIELTSYGMSAESYETVSRIPGSFEQFRRGIDLLRSRGIRFSVKGTLLPPAKSEIEAFIKWHEEICQQQRLPSLVLFLELRHRRDSIQKNGRIIKMRLPPKEGLAYLSRNRDNFISDVHSICKYSTTKPTALLFTCNAGNRLCIDAYGRIQYCLALRHLDTVVDSRSHCIRYYLNEFLPELRKMRATNQEYLKRCARCMLRGLCEQCPAKSWIEHGVLDQPVEYCCEVAHAQARWLGILKEDEYGWEVRDWMERVRRLEKSA